MKPVRVRTCDVLIVGGGIAGISIAERLAREASRQGKKIRILLVDAAEELGIGASGSLEGWFHTGFLYSMLKDTSLLFTFVHSLEDLYNFYLYDVLFSARVRNCNLRDVTETHLPGYDFNRPGCEPWFLNRVPYLVTSPATVPGSTYERMAGGDRQRSVESTMQQAAQCFFSDSWVDPVFGCCAAPHARVASANPLDVDFPGAVDDRGKSNQNSGSMERLSRGLAAVVDRLQESVGRPQVSVMTSLDALMNPWRILTDLTTAAADFGVEILCGYKLDSNSIQVSPYGAADSVEGGVLFTRDDHEPALHVIAEQYVFALGAGFDEVEFLRDRLDVRVKVQKKTSVMLVAEPPLGPETFVRLDHSSKNTFNHFCRARPNCGSGVPYSIVADSNALPPNATDQDCANAAAALIEKARIYFGDRVDEVRLHWYTCLKTEFPAATTDRSYSYWWGPTYRQWASGNWRGTLGDGKQRLAEDLIRGIVVAGECGAACGEIGPVSESSWAAKKALHFALLQLISAERLADPDAVAATRRNFSAFQEQTASIFSAATVADRLLCDELHRKSSDDQRATPNLLCVVPGKFSLFPTLAHGVYLELESRGLFLTLAAGRTASATNATVAKPKPEMMLSGMGEEASEASLSAIHGR